METKDQIRKRLKSNNIDGSEPTPSSDFTKLPDEMLSNIHLYDWYDKLSIQASVEMSRRLKDAIAKMDVSSRRLAITLAVVASILALVQIVIAVFPSK